MIYLIFLIGITLSSYLFFRFTYLICVHNYFMFNCFFYIQTNNLLIIDLITLIYMFLWVLYFLFKFNINMRD
jgi:hypothetical protein